MEKALKNRLILLAKDYIGERSSVLVTGDSNVFYTENFNKCQNYCIPRGLEFIEVTKADIEGLETPKTEPKAKTEEPITDKPKRARRKRTNKED